MQIIIPMAGQGSRFSKAGFDLPKPLILANGKTLVEHSIESLGISGKFIFITRTFDNPEHNEQLTEIFNRLCPDFVEIKIDEKHLGAAHSASFAENYVNPEEPLVITNCDQYLDWDADRFVNSAKLKNADGAVVLYKSTNPKNSFALISNDRVTAIAEKQPISDNALIGVHYWKRAQDFFDSAKLLLADFEDQGYPECYVSVTYNYMIRNDKKIVPYFTDGYYSLGTPDDLERFQNEF